MANRINFTKATIDALPLPQAGQQAYYYDTKVRALALRVSPNGVKTFVVYRKHEGKPCRVTVGRYPDLTITQARDQSGGINSRFTLGINPVDEKKEATARSITLADAVKAFLASRKNLSPRTRYDYNRLLDTYLWDWKDKRVAAITKDMVEKRHELIAKGMRIPSKKGKDGWVDVASETQANYTMRFLRAIINFSMVKYEDSQGKPLLPENPVRRLSQVRAWYPVERRQTVIKAHQIADWLTAVLGLESDAINGKAEVVRDYLIFILLTGARRGEAAKLRKDDVDLKDRTFTLFDTKNKQPHTLPLSDYLYLLAKRRVEADDSEFLFSGTGKHGYLVEPKKQMMKVTKDSGVHFTLHDLRRTFASIAESLDISAYALKRLLNHKMKNDVTAGYIVTDVERLRRPMQMVTNFILQTAGIEMVHAAGDDDPTKRFDLSERYQARKKKAPNWAP
jgi:integrase